MSNQTEITSEVLSKTSTRLSTLNYKLLEEDDILSIPLLKVEVKLTQQMITDKSIPVNEDFIQLNSQNLEEIEIWIKDYIDVFDGSRKQGIEYPLLTDADRIGIIEVNRKIADFELIIKNSIIHSKDTFSNCIIITGDPGTGKTHNIVTWMEELSQMGLIESYYPVSGKVSPVTLFALLRDENPAAHEKCKVTILDDCDVWNNQDSMNILKAACNTKSGKGGDRTVTYGTRGDFQKFDYNGFLIIITNNKFDEWDSDEIGDHLKAVLDRAHQMKLDLTKDDMMLKNTSIIEDFINTDTNIPPSIKETVVDFYNNEIKEFNKYGLFEKCGITFSVRFVMKVVDLQIMFGDKWKRLSTDYIKLNANLKLLKK